MKFLRLILKIEILNRWERKSSGNGVSVPYILQACALALILVIVSLFMGGCTKVSPLADFKYVDTTLLIKSNASWSDATQISSGQNVNDDRDSDSSGICVYDTVGLTGMLNTSGIGCMQSPALAYANDRWITGFPMVNSSNSNYFSIFSNLIPTSLSLMTTAAAIDTAAVHDARYVRFAKLSNDDILAVYWLEDGTATDYRQVYATVYDSSAHTWGTAQRLSTASKHTDFGTDGLDSSMNLAFLCRPKVAASEDGSAMVVWCEESGASPDSEVKYRIYNSGSWIPAIGSNPSSLGTNTSLYFPGFVADAARMDKEDSSGAPAAHTPFNDTMTNILTDGQEAYSITVNVGVGNGRPINTGACTDTHVAKVYATPYTPASNEFKIVIDDDGDIQECDTMKNMARALSAVATTASTTCTNSATSTSLSSLGISVVVDDDCDDSDSTTWNITHYYNKALDGKFLENATSTSYDYVAIGTLQYYTAAGGGPYEFDGNPAQATRSFTNSTSVNYTWLKSAMVDVAADKNGNYSVVRSVVSPYFKESGVSVNDVGYGRMLVGHEYSTTTGWKSVRDTSSTTKLSTKKISPTPACLGESDYSTCNVRNPKVVLSSEGKGYVFYYRNQQDPYSGSSFQNRIWYTTYSTSSGYGPTSNILDSDTICSTSSVENDVPVCETGSYSTPCETLSESQTTTALERAYPTPTVTPEYIDHDVPPITAVMSRAGTGVIVYHKMVNTGSSTSPSCSYNGTFVRVFNTDSGFSTTSQLDDDLGDTMHAQASVNASGKIAVVWEQVESSDVYLYLRTYYAGIWSDAVEIASSTTSDTDSMMPSVEINDSNEILVSYSLGKYSSLTSASRHQYVKRYTP